MIYIIEHLEKRLWPWCIIEYKSISKIVGKNNLWFTNLGSSRMKGYGKVSRESVRRMKLERACILDPDAKETLTPEMAKEFDYFIFGGILGDQEFNWRTKKELSKHMKCKKFNLGKGQFSTDNAVFVTKEIIEGKRLADIKFQDNIEIKTGKYDSFILPYRYPMVKGKPRISKELVRYLKRKKSF